MTDQPGFTQPVPATPGLPPAQTAQAAVQQQLTQQAADLGGSTDAGPTLEQIQKAQREAILPYENQLADAMKQMAAMQAQMKDLQAGVTAAQQAAGPPQVEQYANGVAALVKAHAAANPDLDPAVFAGPLKTAEALKAAATAMVTSQDPADVTSLAGEIETWVGSFRHKHLDFSGLRADLELLGGAVAKLAAV
jgi:hypothetical protein